jgi:putative transposase
LRRPVESAQYTSIDYTQTLTDHRMLASVGSVGDAHDNALAESFVDSFKTELIAERVWRSRGQLELAVVGYIGWYNYDRPHESLGYLSPAEHEQGRQALNAAEPPNPDKQSPAPLARTTSEALTAPRLIGTGARTARNGADHDRPATIARPLDTLSAPHTRPQRTTPERAMTVIKRKNGTNQTGPRRSRSSSPDPE